jgi:tRNA (guanine37-N1)-methyltransferase
MRVTFVTLFPEMLEPVVRASILGRASRARAPSLSTTAAAPTEAKVRTPVPEELLPPPLQIAMVQLRDFSNNKHRTVDEPPAGGGAGMLLRVDVVVPAVRHALAQASDVAHTATRVVFFDARGDLFAQTRAKTYARDVGHLVLVCGRYEGFDHRVFFSDFGVAVDVLSVGDFILTGGELPALVVLDAVARLLPGVLGNDESAVGESHGDERLLEYRQYTRPVTFEGQGIPPVLLSGHHARITQARRKDALLLTRAYRPDLFVRRRRDKGLDKLLADARIASLDATTEGPPLPLATSLPDSPESQ